MIEKIKKHLSQDYPDELYEDDEMGDKINELVEAVNKLEKKPKRPEWSDIEKLSGYILCTCGNVLQTKQAIRKHWQDGHFDI